MTSEKFAIFNVLFIKNKYIMFLDIAAAIVKAFGICYNGKKHRGK